VLIKTGLIVAIIATAVYLPLTANAGFYCQEDYAYPHPKNAGITICSEQQIVDGMKIAALLKGLSLSGNFVNGFDGPQALSGSSGDTCSVQIVAESDVLVSLKVEANVKGKQLEFIDSFDTSRHIVFVDRKNQDFDIWVNKEYHLYQGAPNEVDLVPLGPSFKLKISSDQISFLSTEDRLFGVSCRINSGTLTPPLRSQYSY